MRRIFFYLVGLLLVLPCWADDIEIYLGSGSNVQTYNPNVLFIIDTSGSMTNQDGTGQTRLLRVQNALNSALTNATNINAGLMRFSDYGGPILYPVSNINNTANPQLVMSIQGEAHDVVEVGTNYYETNSSLNISNGTQTTYTGLHYQNVDIPQGATITNAYLRFTSALLNSATTNITLQAELVADATAFSTSQRPSSRLTTQASVSWDDDNTFPLVGETFTSPDLTNVVQEIISQSAWCGGHNLNMLITSQGVATDSLRKVESYESGNGLAPQLVVEYDSSTATGCVTGSLSYQVENTNNNAEERSDGNESTGTELTFNSSANDFIGVRFDDVDVPNGATITDAYLVFTAYATHTGAASMDIQAVAEDDPNDFAVYNQYLLRDKEKTSAVTWVVPEFSYRQEYQSPSLVTQVQSIINRNGWQSGQAMMFTMSNFSGDRGAYTYYGRPSGAVRLVIEFQGNATPTTAFTVRELLQSKVNELSANGYTPIVDTLYEAALYYGGRDMEYGDTRGGYYTSSSVKRSTRVSDRFAYLGADAIRPNGCSENNLSDSACEDEYIPTPATYISPISDWQCQTNNHIVLLSDGEANNNHSQSKIENLLNTSCVGSSGEICGTELVANLASINDSVIGTRVITHTIGFAANTEANDFLNQLALQGGGGFYETDDTQALVNVFEDIIRSVKDVNVTFVSPGVAVNQLNRLTNDDELYFALFKPSENAIWPGNLKRYRLQGSDIYDQNDVLAVDSSSGFFSDYAQSFWSTVTDGSAVKEGGAAAQLTSTRQVFTFNNTPGNLITLNNQVTSSNTLITTTDLGVDAESDPTYLRTQIINWASGIDVRDDDGDGLTNDVRQEYGDPIHSQPVIMNYGPDDAVVFFTTNQGFLHAVDTDTGAELYSLIPRELLPNLQDFYRNQSVFNHIYGLDGDLVLHHFADASYLYVGMRRGGNNYYVFDITDKLAPKLVFTIDGGSGEYAQLGQTWSRPVITKININGTVKDVMIFAGGYDEGQDNYTVRTSDNVGKRIFIVDARTGQLLFDIGESGADLSLPTMQYSIPARVAVIDRQGDGLADHLYVGDMGGQLFRFDIYHGASGSDLVKGARIADLAGASTNDNRRFYNAPDVAEYNDGSGNYYAIVIGSGYRAHPLNTTVADRFYMLKDSGPFTLNETYQYSLPTSALNENALYDVSAHLVNNIDATTQAIALSELANSDGWLLPLSTAGEKVLASPIVLDYQVFFTTYIPAESSVGACTPPEGTSRAYLVSLSAGSAVTDINQDGTVDANDRGTEIRQTGIAPDPRILVEDITQPAICLGAECLSAVKQYDSNGQLLSCSSELACLTENLFGRFERLHKRSWRTEIERE